MRILQVGKYFPPYRGGMETHLADLCSEMKQRVNLEVLVAHNQPETVEDAVDGIPVARLGARWTILSNPVCPELVSRVRQSRADLIHLHWPNPLALASVLASGHRAPLVITYHSDIVKQKLTGALLQPLFDWAARRAVIIATSPNYLESSPVLRKHRSRCHVIPLGIEPTQFQNPDPALVRAYRARFGHRLVLTSGRHVYYKGFQHLIQAMQHVEGHLALTSEGPLTNELRQLAAAVGVADRVTFLGNVSDAERNALYAACAVFALPSIARSEAFGLVQLEAMAAGKPVVNTAIDSGVPFVSRDRETGFTVAPADPRALAQALAQLLSNPELRARFGAAARQRVYESFTLTTMAAQTHELYREVLGLAVRPAAQAAAGVA